MGMLNPRCKDCFLGWKSFETNKGLQNQNQSPIVDTILKCFKRVHELGIVNETQVKANFCSVEGLLLCSDRCIADPSQASLIDF